MAINHQIPFVSEYGELSNGILLNIAEILTLRLPEGSERVIASKWVKKFLACQPADYKNNLALFVSSLTKQVLVKPFDEAPQDQSNQWIDFDKEYKPIDIHRGVKQRVLKDAYAPPYKVEISQNMKEFTAFQEIPFFGSHFFYAFSVDERLDKWRNFSKLNVPKSYIKALQIEDMLEESPIKRCKFPKQSLAYQVKGKPRAAALKLKKPSAKPGLGVTIEEEEIPADPANKTAISFPTDVPPSNLPAKLQKRFIEGARQKEERLQAIAEKMKEGATPAVGPKGHPKKVPKKNLNRTTPNLGTSKGQTPADQSQRAGTKESSRQVLFEDDDQEEAVEKPGEEVRVKTQLESYREYIDSLKALPTQIKQTSDALRNEIARTNRELTPNTPAVNEIQDQEIGIGNELADIVSEQVKMNRWERMRKLNQTDDPDLMNLSADFRFLDERRAGNAGVQVRPETLKRLTELKKRAEMAHKMSMTAIEPRELLMDIIPDDSLEDFEQMEAEAAAEAVLDILDNAVQGATEANLNLEELVPQTEADVQLVSDLIQSNNLIIKEAAPSVQQLIAAIEKKDNHLPRMVVRAVNNLNKSIGKSNEIDQNAVENTPESPVAAHASIIQDDRNIVLADISNNAAEISRIANATQKQWEQGYLPADASVRQHMGHSDGIIDLTQVDTNFGAGEVDIADFLNATRNTRQQHIREASDRFRELAGNLDEENLGDLDDNFLQLLDESLELCEQLDEELMENYENIESDELQAEIDLLREEVQDLMKTIRESDLKKSREIQPDYQRAPSAELQEEIDVLQKEIQDLARAIRLDDS